MRQTRSQNPGEFFPQNGLFSLVSMLVCIRSGRLDRWPGPSAQASIVPNGDGGAMGASLSRSEAWICDGYRKCGLAAAGESVIPPCAPHAGRQRIRWARCPCGTCARRVATQRVSQGQNLSVARAGAGPRRSLRRGWRCGVESGAAFAEFSFGNSNAGGDKNMMIERVAGIF